jgi:hypothetical protein
MCEYGTLKPAAGVISRRGVWEKKEIKRDGPNQGTKYMYIWKCHNETACIMIIY